MAVKELIIGKLVREIYIADSYDKAFDVFSEMIFDRGFNGVCYTYVPQITIDSELSILPVFKTRGSRLESFINYYVDKSLYLYDFNLRMIKEGATEVIDWWHEAQKGNLSDIEFEQLQLSKEKFYILNGFTIPIMSKEHGIACVAITSDKEGEAYDCLKAENREILNISTLIFHGYTLAYPESEKMFVRPSFPELTEKEVIVLRFLLTGKPMKLFDESTGISPAYAEKILINLRKKFGNISTIQLIHQAGVFNMLG